jgi:hypothetical protein
VMTAATWFAHRQRTRPNRHRHPSEKFDSMWDFIVRELGAGPGKVTTDCQAICASRSEVG